MNSKRRTLTCGFIGFLTIFLIVCSLQLPAHAQDGVGNLTSGILDKVLTYLNTIAEAIGRFLVYIINMITGVKLTQLVMPLGYLGEITLMLMAIGILEGAKKVLWLLVWAGWGLIAVRVVIEVMEASSV
ncbi:hypothetical protein KGY79_06380 [Candidatus Bipolaricaulota bacterium]|nr:hypothetical protein [Candidatus Bipolaricaulota bacterium]